MPEPLTKSMSTCQCEESSSTYCTDDSNGVRLTSPEMKKAPTVLEHVEAEKRELSADTSQGKRTHTPPSKSTASGSDPQNTVPHGRKQKTKNIFQSSVPPTHNESTNTENASMPKKTVEATESASGPMSLTIDIFELSVGSKCHDCKGGSGNSKAVYISDNTSCPLCHLRYECLTECQEKVRDDIQQLGNLNLKDSMGAVPEVAFWTNWN